MSHTIQTPDQHWYLARLLGYDYTIQYRVGKANIVADALSRSMETASIYLLSVPCFVFLEDLHKELASLPAFLALRDSILKEPEVHGDYTLSDGLILH